MLTQYPFSIEIILMTLIFFLYYYFVCVCGGGGQFFLSQHIGNITMAMQTLRFGIFHVILGKIRAVCMHHTLPQICSIQRQINPKSRAITQLKIYENFNAVVST